MLSRPKHGWTEVTVNGQFLGAASYVGNTPIEVLQTCYNRLSAESDKFELIFDAEGYFFGITQIHDDFYSFREDEEMTVTGPLNETDAATFIRNITVEVVQDVQDYFEDWVKFCSLDIPENFQENRNILNGLINSIKELLEEYEALERFDQAYVYDIEDRDSFENKFQELLDLGFDGYGHTEAEHLDKYNQRLDSKVSTEHLHYFDNGVFSMKPYYWGDAEDLILFPNFYYYPEDISITWYKYPLRSPQANKELNFEQFCSIINKCKESLLEEMNNED